MTVIPGPDVQVIDAPPPAAPATNTGTAFVSGLADRGTVSGGLTPSDVITTLGDFIARHGARQSYNGRTFDAVEAFFADGGARLYFSRQAGADAVLASVAIGAKFTATAKGPGASYNDISVAVAGGVISVFDGDGDTPVEVSPALADTAAAQAWAAASSDLITITPLAAGALADTAVTPLEDGDDDRAGISGTEIAASLTRFVKGLGPGNVAVPGDTTALTHGVVAAHAVANNRFGYVDMPDAEDVATVVTAGVTIRALGRDLARHVQALDPWLTALGTSPGSTRTVAPSGVMLGLAARSDASGNVNRAIAGPGSFSRFAVATKYARTDGERGQLSDAGVTPFIVGDSGVQPYDDITPVDPVVEPEWLGAAANRFVMWVVSEALVIARAHMFGPLSGTAMLTAFEGDLKGLLSPLVSAEGPLYGDTAADAFRVDVLGVNTPDTIAARQLKAGLRLKIAPNVRQVLVQITNTPIQEAL